MSEIKYMSDHELKYKTEILSTIQAYNLTKTGERKKDNYYIYAFHDNELVGGLHTEQFWDWAFIGKLYYKDFTVLKVLLNQMYKYYKDDVVGIQYASNDDIIVKHFLECGFIINGELPDYPKGKTKKDLLNTNLNLIEMTIEYDMTFYNERPMANNEMMDNLINVDQNKQIDLQFVALDDKIFAGGVYGYIKNEYLYISLLVVSDLYKNKRIASQLMDLIEEESHVRGYNNFYLDTCEFQALGFYLKRNYQIAATIKEFPKGFNEYMLVKKYNE